MAITITKPKKTEEVGLPKLEVTIFEPAKLTLEELVDLYGFLKDETEAILSNPSFVKFSTTAKALLDRINEEAGETDSVEITGAHWLIEAGGCSKVPRKVIDVPAIAKMLGNETFFKIAKVGLSDLDKYLTPDQLGKVLDQKVAYTPNRKIVAKFLG